MGASLKRGRNSPHAITSALRAEERRLWELNSAIREAEFGNPDRAQEEVLQGIAIVSTGEVKARTDSCLSR